MEISKSKATFNQIRTDVRADLENLNQLNGVLLGRLKGNLIDEDTRIWITDVFIDKFQELKIKISRIVKEMTDSVSYSEFEQSMNSVISRAHELAFTDDFGDVAMHKIYLESYVKDSIKEAEGVFVEVQGVLWEKDWKGLEKIKPIEFLVTERIKYVNARESLQKARESLEGKIEDVTLHLRPAIDLSIKERFGFKTLHPMSKFINDAKKFGFPLPSYDFIYTIFDEGSDRMHSGKPPTSFEAKEMITTVSHFIDSLETITVDKEKIEDFKKKCSAVE